MNPKTAANELKLHVMKHVRCVINPLKPNDAYTGRTASEISHLLCALLSLFPKFKKIRP